MTSFVKKGPQSPNKAIKSWLLPTLLGLFLFTAGSSLAWYEDFDDYTSGDDLAGNENWTSSGTSYKITNTYSNSSPNSIFGNNVASFVANASSTNVSTGLFSASFLITTNSENFATSYFFKDRNGLSAFTFQIEDEDGYATGTWHDLEINFNSITDFYSYRVDQGSWATSTAFSNAVDSISLFEISCSAGDDVVFTDDIRIEALTGSGSSPEFSLDEPVLCERNIVDFDEVVFDGNITIATENPYVFDNILVFLEAVYTQATTTALTIEYFDIALPDLTAGEGYDFYATTTLSRDNPFWRARFRFDGYDDFGYRYVFWYIPTTNCQTILTETAELPVEVLEEIGYYEELEPSDCSGLTLTETFLCNIKNILQGIFVPSQAQVAKLNQNIQLLGQKFPMNYISEAKNFFSDINDGVSATSTIQLSLLNATGTVDFSVWEQDATVAGTSQTTGNVFRGFFGAVFVFGFIVYAINFGKRVFK